MKNNTSTEEASAAFLAALLEPVKDRKADTTRRQGKDASTTIQHVTINRPTRCTIIIGAPMRSGRKKTHE